MDWEVIATGIMALGVFFAGWQIRQSRKLSQTTFEDSFDTQYRNLSMIIPVDALLGKEVPESQKKEVREIVFNYLDLCNEQIYLRQVKRVGKARWNVWCEGIRDNLSKPTFEEVWEEVKRESPDEFSYLLKLENGEFNKDPFHW